jgi:hypothetical protein
VFPVPWIVDTGGRCVVRGRWCRTLSQVRRRKGSARLDDFCATSCRFRGSARPLRAWFVPAGSPPPAQFIENSRCWQETTRLGGFPGCRKRFVQGSPLLVGEVITFVVGNQIDNRPLRQCRRLVENQSSLLNTCSERAHTATVRDSKRGGKPSCCGSRVPLLARAGLEAELLQLVDLNDSHRVLLQLHKSS